MALETPPNLHVSVSPHIRYGETVRSIMLWVCACLAPALAASFFIFGWYSLLIVGLSVASAVSCEWLIIAIRRKPSTIHDCSALVTGLLVGLMLPPMVPFWIPLLGSAFAIGVVKMTFGGLGHSIVNPALAARAFLMISYPSIMSLFSAPQIGFIDGINGSTGATPLHAFKNAMAAGTFQPLDFQEALLNLFLGRTGGCIGETCGAALLVGGIVLAYRHVISLRIPLFYIITVFVCFWFFGGAKDALSTDGLIIPFYQILSGSLLLGAFFMATDPVTSPVIPAARVWYAIGCGILTYLFRKFSAYPEGVTFAILCMNLCTPLLDRAMRPRFLGEAKKRA